MTIAYAQYLIVDQTGTRHGRLLRALVSVAAAAAAGRTATALLRYYGLAECLLSLGICAACTDYLGARLIALV